jgi:signal transduction histidine kinase
MLGGHLAVESVVNQGTTFTMKVPARSKEKAAPASTGTKSELKSE